MLPRKLKNCHATTESAINSSTTQMDKASAALYNVGQLMSVLFLVCKRRHKAVNPSNSSPWAHFPFNDSRKEDEVL